MKTVARFMGLSVALGGLLMALPQTSLADKDGKPNKKSVATTAACVYEPDTEGFYSAHVYSCKALSNVVLWCGGSYVKYDNIGSDPSTGDEKEVYDAVFDCPDAYEKITYIAIKSGSQKHNKHNDGYVAPDLPESAPPGSGLFVGDIPACLLDEDQIPRRGKCDVDPVEPPPPPPHTGG